MKRTAPIAHVLETSASGPSICVSIAEITLGSMDFLSPRLSRGEGHISDHLSTSQLLQAAMMKTGRRSGEIASVLPIADPHLFAFSFRRNVDRSLLPGEVRRLSQVGPRPHILNER